MKKRLCAFLMAFGMTLSAFAGLVHPACAAEEKVLVDWNCDSLTAAGVSVNQNQYPHYYFADSKTAGVAAGTVHMGGDGAAAGYATMAISAAAMESAAFTLEMDMKVDALMTPTAYPTYRGFVMEFALPDNKMIYIVLQDMGTPDANGNNATIRVSKTERAGDDGYAERISIPADGAFHRWMLRYDGVSKLLLAIDGQVIREFADVNVPHTSAAGLLQFKNVMINMAGGSTANSVTFDSIRLTEGVSYDTCRIKSVAVSPEASAERFTVSVSVEPFLPDRDLFVTVYPQGEKHRAVTGCYRPTGTVSSGTLANLPFTGACTVSVSYPGARAYEFDTYIYRSCETVEAGATVQAEQPGRVYVYRNPGLIPPPGIHDWYPLEYETAAGKYTALCVPSADAGSIAVMPVTLTGKYAVYIGYLDGSSRITVNGTDVILPKVSSTVSSIRETFATAVDLQNGQITLSNTHHNAAQIAYVKFVSLSDEQYEIAVAEDDSHTFITDNDGYSTLVYEGKGNYNTLFYQDFLKRTNTIDQRQFIWCTFSTSILNYDSAVWWEYTTKRLKELNIPEENWPADFLDHVDVNGNHVNYDHLMRDIDKIAYENMRALNQIGYPHEVLSNMMAAQIEGGEFYVSLRMSHYNVGAYSFQTGTLYHLHPEWIRGGGVQASYYYEEYRNYLHDILVEMAQPTNVTGILMDFGRYYYIFGSELTSLSRRTAIMNDFVKSVHDDLPAGKKLTVRVLDPIYEKATQWGLDYQTWVKNGWVDRVYISCQTHETFFDFSDYIAFFEDYPEVEFYLGVNATLSGHDLTKEEEEILKAGGTIPRGERVSDVDIMLRVYDFYEAGADGVFTFNWAGTDAMFKNMNNATLMRKWYHFSYPLLMMSTQPVRVDGAGSLPVTSAVSVPMMQIPACDTAAALTVEARAELLPFPVTDAAWAAALTVNKAENPSLYTRFGKTGQAAYHYDAGTDRLYLSVTYDLASWIGDLSLVDAYGNEIPFRTDRLYGTPKEGNTLWSHSYADSGHADAVKTLWLFVENVTRLPDKYVLYVRNTGTTAYYTAKLTVDFPDTGAGEETDGVPGDVNGDGVFDYYDVARLYAFHRGKAVPEAGNVTDVNGDGVFDYYDVAKLYAVHRGKGSFD